MRQTNRYREACAMPKSFKEPVIDKKSGKQKINRNTGKPEFKLARNEERTAAFKALNEEFGFTESSFQRSAIRIARACSIGDHLGSDIIQKTATRVFKALQQYAFGNRGKPRFKGLSQWVTLENKKNAANMRYRDGILYFGRIPMKALVPDEHHDRKGYVRKCLESEICHSRIVSRMQHSRRRFFLQLVLLGTPPRNVTRACSGRVGMDLGPSSYAAWAPEAEEAKLAPLAPEIKDVRKEARRTQRAMDRSRRATNPDCFNPDGTMKKGKKCENRSGHYERLAARLADEQRRLAQTRKASHGRATNYLLSLGLDIFIEKVSKKGWQKIWGRAIRDRAPGMFESMLKRKAESAGGSVHMLSTFKTALSQTCACGKKTEKKLSDRVHACPGCGRVMQRDLMSAYLAAYVDGNFSLLPSVESDWASAEPLLRRAWERAIQTASGRNRLGSFGAIPCGFARMSVSEERLAARPPDGMPPCHGGRSRGSHVEAEPLRGKEDRERTTPDGCPPPMEAEVAGNSGPTNAESTSVFGGRCL